MEHKILSVEEGTPAWRYGLRAGDVLMDIDGKPVLDILDYQSRTVPGRFKMRFRHGGRGYTAIIRKQEYEPLGLRFEDWLMSPMQTCANACRFCFVDQMPAGLRDTLYVKDDDWRMSLLMGNFVTLTNVGPKQLQRIIDEHVSPLYVSVHAMDPEMRAFLLNNPRAGNIAEVLGRLAEAGIEFHAQAVVCPGLNDGEVLRDTIERLAALHPAARSFAAVPVGLTCHRDGLYPLRLFSREEAGALIDMVESMQREYMEKWGTSFAFIADEFYVKAGRELPPYAHYEDFPQIENGVGLLRNLEGSYLDAWEKMILPRRDICVATSMAAAKFLGDMLLEYPLGSLHIRVLPVENHFFGPTVTVAGLLAGSDYLRALRDAPEPEVWISAYSLREGEEVFLDDMTLAELSEKTGKKILALPDDGEAWIKAAMGRQGGNQ